MCDDRRAIVAPHRIWPALVAATVGSAIALFDGTVITVALPSIQRDLGLSPAAQGWVVQAYLLAPIAVLPAGGALADRIGRRRAFTFGVGLLGLGSLVCALAPGPGTLIAGRAVQGAGVGLTMPASLAMLAAAARGRAERRRVVAQWTTWTAAASAAGPVLGGVVTSGPGWRWIFWLSAAGAFGSLVLARAGVAESRDVRAQAPEWSGAAFLIVAVAAAGFALGAESGEGPTDPAVLAPGLLALAALAAFIARERRGADPLIPLVMFTHPLFRAANVLTASVYGGLFAALFFVSIFLQQAQGLSPLEGGLTMLPFAVALVVAAPFGTRLGRSRGPRLPVTAGCLLAGVPLLALAFTPPEPIVVGLLTAAAGLGLGAAGGPLMAAVVDAVELRRAAVATGVNAAVSRLAAISAIAGLGVVASLAFDRGLERERVSADARAAIGIRVFAAPRRLDDRGFSDTQVARADAAAETAFGVVMGVAGAVLVLSALVAAMKLGTPVGDQTGEMPIAVITAPMAIVMREHLPLRRGEPRRRATVRGPPAPPAR